MTYRSTAFRAAFVGTAALLASACLPAEGNYTGAAAVKRSEVQLTRLTHEVRFNGATSMDAIEAAAVNAFLDRNSVGFGDTLFLDLGVNDNPGRRHAIAEHLRRQGLKLAGGAPLIGPEPASGTGVLIVERHTIVPPRCPDWSEDSSKNYAVAVSSNFGCANQVNLSQMIADPADLVKENAANAPTMTDHTVAAAGLRRGMLPGGVTAGGLKKPAGGIGN